MLRNYYSTAAVLPHLAELHCSHCRGCSPAPAEPRTTLPPPCASQGHALLLLRQALFVGQGQARAAGRSCCVQHFTTARRRPGPQALLFKGTAAYCESRTEMIQCLPLPEPGRTSGISGWIPAYFLILCHFIKLHRLARRLAFNVNVP